MTLRRPVRESPARVTPPLRVTRPTATGLPLVARAALRDVAPAQPKAVRAGRARPSEPLAARCEVDGCRSVASARHHRKLRRHGGCDCQANTLDVCTADHLRIHANPAASYAAGWLLHSWQNPHETLGT